MTGSLTALFISGLVFVAGHSLLSHPLMRGALVARLGEKVFRAVYSVVALATMIWLVKAYGAAPYWEVWPPLGWMRHVTLAIMPLAAIFLVAGVTVRNPTAMYWDKPDSGEHIPGILKVTRHPVMWAVTFWAASHMIPNGDAASLIFFAAFAVLALMGMRAIDRRRKAVMGGDWEAFARATSGVPFLAIFQGRATFSLGEIGVVKIVGGFVLYTVFLFGHQAVIGVSPLLP